MIKQKICAHRAPLNAEERGCLHYFSFLPFPLNKAQADQRMGPCSQLNLVVAPHWQLAARPRFSSIATTPAPSLVDQLVLQHSSRQLDEHSTLQIFQLTPQLWHLDRRDLF